jgi:hypothetical protein
VILNGANAQFKRYGYFAAENADQWATAARREAVRAVEPVKAELVA